MQSGKSSISGARTNSNASGVSSQSDKATNLTEDEKYGTWNGKEGPKRPEGAEAPKRAPGIEASNTAEPTKVKAARLAREQAEADRLAQQKRDDAKAAAAAAAAKANGDSTTTTSGTESSAGRLAPSSSSGTPTADSASSKPKSFAESVNASFHSKMKSIRSWFGGSSDGGSEKSSVMSSIRSMAGSIAGTALALMQGAAAVLGTITGIQEISKHRKGDVLVDPAPSGVHANSPPSLKGKKVQAKRIVFSGFPNFFRAIP